MPNGFPGCWIYSRDPGMFFIHEARWHWPETNNVQHAYDAEAVMRHLACPAKGQSEPIDRPIDPRTRGTRARDALNATRGPTFSLFVRGDRSIVRLESAERGCSPGIAHRSTEQVADGAGSDASSGATGCAGLGRAPNVLFHARRTIPRTPSAFSGAAKSVTLRCFSPQSGTSSCST